MKRNSNDPILAFPHKEKIEIPDAFNDLCVRRSHRGHPAGRAWTSPLAQTLQDVI
jgi:hypothetical protein